MPVHFSHAICFSEILIISFFFFFCCVVLSLVRVTRLDFTMMTWQTLATRISHHTQRSGHEIIMI